MGFIRIFVFFALLPYAVIAKDVEQQLPPELMYQGKPIDPYCLEQMTGIGEVVEKLDLAKCSLKDIKVITTQAPQKDARVQGYEYQYAGQDGGISFTQYRYIGQFQGLTIIESSYSGGGTGFFTSILGLKRNGDTIVSAKYFAGGDRCDGGITNAKIDSDRLVVDVNVTPNKLLHLIDDPSAENDSYSSCVAVARYVDEKFSAVLPTKQGIANIKSNPEKSCFDKAYLNAVALNDKEWSLADLKQFIGKFNKDCPESKKGK